MKGTKNCFDRKYGFGEHRFWLNNKPNGSVLYISFGSYLVSNQSDIEDLASGILLSKVNFIWVPLSFDRLLNSDQFYEGNLQVFPAHVDELVGNLVRDDPSVSCLIADTFYAWTSKIAKKYDLVNVSFWTEPALVFTLNYHLNLLVSNGHFASRGMFYSESFLFGTP